MFTTSKASGSCGDKKHMDLPPGFRFHPTDEELITHYLSPKVLDNSFCSRAIGEVDLNKVEPWDLPWMAKMGEKEWYFFCMRDRKYPTGLRTNRATEAGYWKATGKDKEIFKVKKLVGMKKTLVFYEGRAPRGEKSNWVMHEFRLEANNSTHTLNKPARNEWVICRIFKKSSGGKKIHISGLNRTPNNYGDDFPYSNLPQLLDLSFSEDHQTRASKTNKISSHVTCFSKQVDDDHKPINNMFDDSQSFSVFETFNQMDLVLMQDHSLLKILLENNVKTEVSQDTGMSTDISSSSPMSMSNHEVGLKPFDDQYFSMSSNGPVDIGCLWDY